METYRVNLSVNFIGSPNPTCFVKTCKTEKQIVKFLKANVKRPYRRIILSIWNEQKKQYEWDLAKKILGQK